MGFHSESIMRLLLIHHVTMNIKFTGKKDDYLAGAQEMNYFLKLNAVSILYALMFFAPAELMVNVYRISRLTGWEIGTVNTLTGVVLLSEVIAGSILLYFLTKKWLNGRKANFWTAFLWIPYFFLFTYIFASLFPITYGGDDPNPASGLLLIGGFICYPIYILLLNFFGVAAEDKPN
jgi:hypothetical protein